MGFFSKPTPDDLSSISNNQIWQLGVKGLDKKFLWFVKTGYLNDSNVFSREIDINSEGTPELKEFFSDLFKEISEHGFAKMQKWPNECNFNEGNPFVPQDRTVEFGNQMQNQKTMTLFGFIDSTVEEQAIYFTKVTDDEKGNKVKSLVRVVNLNILNNENSWFILQQIKPKKTDFNLCLFMTISFDLGAKKPSNLYLHLPSNFNEMRKFLDKVSL